ncbi:hypothetical protein CVT23_00040 [Minwuia thermotolerans]|uniref:Sel1 repeat family protein n=2 Tax=Minwuia thermotolerans TaxID=2056226 RepID=A0A2M9G7P5_9PROT|nr:hypothetical protein CVT23_00040 [Minwuia thermotolerans]
MREGTLMARDAVYICTVALFIFGNAQSVVAGIEEAEKLQAAGDHTAALEEYVSTGGEGDVEASFRAAQMFERGEGTPEPRLEKAAAWYQVAARAGHLTALTALAEMFADGRGVDKDRTQAWALLDIAAQKGHTDAAAKRDKLAEQMSENELAAGQRRAEKIAPKYMN